MIIRNATILDFQDLSRRSGVDLRIEAGRIVEVGKGWPGKVRAVIQTGALPRTPAGVSSPGS